jgi:hypothetical protein
MRPTNIIDFRTARPLEWIGPKPVTDFEALQKLSEAYYRALPRTTKVEPPRAPLWSVVVSLASWLLIGIVTGSIFAG